jgi:hypothetical protein
MVHEFLDRVNVAARSNRCVVKQCRSAQVDRVAILVISNEPPEPCKILFFCSIAVVAHGNRRPDLIEKA